MMKSASFQQQKSTERHTLNSTTSDTRPPTICNAYLESRKSRQLCTPRLLLGLFLRGAFWLGFWRRGKLLNDSNTPNTQNTRPLTIPALHHTRLHTQVEKRARRRGARVVVGRRAARQGKAKGSKPGCSGCCSHSAFIWSSQNRERGSNHELDACMQDKHGR